MSKKTKKEEFCIIEESENIKVRPPTQKKKTILEVITAIKNYAERNNITSDGSCPLQASDISPAAVTLAKEVAQSAGVLELIQFSSLDAANSKPHASCGLIVINPPYGERIGRNSDLPQLYKTIGDTWKLNFPNLTSWLLSSSEPLTKSIGLRSTRKFSVYNGNLECRFLQYVMYAKG